jgi:beta-lactamase class A
MNVEQAVARFAGDDPGRSVALETVRGPAAASRVRADVVRPGASLLKLAVVLALEEAHAEGALDADRPVAVRELPVTRFPTVLRVLEPDHALTLRELGGLCLATSDNPAADHLLRAVGPERVAALLAATGCRDTRLEVGFADAELGAAGRRNVTTADDQVRLFRRVHSEPGWRRAVTALASSVRNTRLPLRLPDELVVAHKTGTLAGVANDAGILFGREVDLVIAVLTDGQPDPPATNLAIGGLARDVWAALGEPVD